MKKRLLFQAVLFLVVCLAGTARVLAQCVGPMSVPVAGSGSGNPLSAGETHVDATCPGVDGSATITASGGTGPYSGTGTFPQMPGTQTYTVTDGNGCTATVQVTVGVLDNTPPSLTCPGPSPIIVSPNSGACTYTVAGTEYNPTGVSDNCAVASTSYTALSGSVSPSSGSSLAGAVLGAGNNVIQWKATDTNGNMNTCQFTIRVNPCIELSGNLIWKGDELSGVGLGTVALTGDAFDTDGPTPSGLLPAGGAYTLIANAGSNFTIAPSKHIFIPPTYTSLLNGLTAADATAIQQHLVGINGITDPYRLVAADANKSNTISTVDAAIIRQAILLNPSAISILNTTKSWRFMPTTPVLTYINPFTVPPFNEFRTVTTMSSMSGLDFYGVKVGDVVESTDPAAKPDPDAKPLVWRVRDRALKTGQTVKLDFSVLNFADIAAYQYALDFETSALQFESVEILTNKIALDPAGNFGTFNLANGELRTLWSVAQGVSLPGVQPMFRLQFKVLSGGKKLSEVLRIDPAALSPVAYNTVLAPREVQLVFADYLSVNQRDEDDLSPDTDLTGPELLQNRPNPFSDRTVIGFILPEAGEAQVRIFDASGRAVFESSQSYPAGYNELQVSLRALGVSGVLFYELTTAQGKVTRKMTALGL